MQNATSQFSRAVVQRRVAELCLDTSNQVLVDHWFSLWSGDALPTREQFSPARIKPFLPSMLISEVVPDESITVRLAGTGYRVILGPGPTRADWIAGAPAGAPKN